MMKFGKKGGKEKSEKKFQYKPLTKELMDKRKSAASGDRENYIRTGIKFYKPASGENTILSLPPGWDTGEEGGYGVAVSVHYGIGSDQSSFLCLKMKGEDCPICRERDKAVKEGDEEYAQQLRASSRYAMFVIDRKKEGEGPMLWVMPSTLEKSLASVSVDKKTGEIVQFIDQDEGYDFSYEKQGEKMKTKYIGAQFDRKPSPLSDDADTQAEWLAYVQENPIPDLLEFAEADHIKKVFGAGEDDGEEKSAKKSGGKPTLGGKGKTAEKKKAKELPTWDEIHELDETEVVAAAEEHGVEGIEKEDFDDLKGAQDWLCEQLEVEAPKKAEKKGKLALGKKKAEEPEEPAELPSWDEVHDMDQDDLTAFAEEREIDLDKEFDGLEEAADYICEQLEIEKPKKGGKASIGKKKAEPEPEELPTYEEIQALAEAEDEDALTELAEKHELDLDQEFDDLADMANKLCEHLELEAPKKEAKKGGMKFGKKKEEKKEEPLPTYAEVHEMDEDALAEFATEKEIDLDKEFDDLGAAADYVCEQLEIEKPAKSKGKLSGLKPKK